MSQPITVWVLPSGPNPWKVVLLLEELGVPYVSKSIRFQDVKQKAFTDVNPNGRVPAIEDPNTKVTLWESGAIILYLIERFDKDHKLSYKSFNERHLCNQWLMFQMSGQGPYYGQASWFNHLHPEKVPSAVERYNDEVRRILSVLETALSKGSRQWLVGDKMTFADLAFYQWNTLLDLITLNQGKPVLDDFPAVKAWQERMHALPSVSRMNQARDRCMEEQNIDPKTGLPKGVTFAEAKAEGEAEKQAAESNP